MILKNLRTIFLSIIIVFSLKGRANVTLPSIWGDHMVLQQNSIVTLWGWGHPTENITVTTSWNTDTLKTKVDNYANWTVLLETPGKGGPHHITIQGYNMVIIKDILIGEVWLLSGQSNMEWTTSSGVTNSEKEIQKSNNDQIRFFTILNRASQYPGLDVEGEWVVCTPETMPHFSAVGYFFGKKIQENINSPVGLICSAWGGTPIESWTPAETIYSDPDLLSAAKKQTEVPWGPVEPSVLFNTMIKPITSFSIAGVLWYQGEANTINADSYTNLLAALIKSWRKEFNNNFPFYFAQIAPYNDYGGDSGVGVRDAQRKVLSTPSTGMIVLSDIGDTTDIHPRNKIDVGYRFADLALNQTYGLKEFPVSGPLFSNFQLKDNKIIIEFKYSKGLYCKEKTLMGFEVCDSIGNWHSAEAKIKDDMVIVQSSKIKKPKHVRFAWKNAATPQLFNSDDLPTSSFTTK